MAVTMVMALAIAMVMAMVLAMPMAMEMVMARAMAMVMAMAMARDCLKTYFQGFLVSDFFFFQRSTTNKGINNA